LMVNKRARSKTYIRGVFQHLPSQPMHGVNRDSQVIHRHRDNSRVDSNDKRVWSQLTLCYLARTGTPFLQSANGAPERLSVANMAAPLLGRCSFFVQRKNRFCKMIAGIGKRFCGEHATMEEGDGGSRRISCPLDPKHTVSEDNLEKHLKKCNSREKPKPGYYVENINAGQADKDQKLQQVTLCERSRAELEALVEKLKTAVEGLQGDVEDRTLSHPILQEELLNPMNGDSAHKHLKQQVRTNTHPGISHTDQRSDEPIKN
ncbi:hypothetical protein AMECASPLE_036550, partial [Ameca splendens]